MSELYCFTSNGFLHIYKIIQLVLFLRDIGLFYNLQVLSFLEIPPFVCRSSIYILHLGHVHYIYIKLIANIKPRGLLKGHLCIYKVSSYGVTSELHHI